MRIAQISDTHLLASGGATTRNAELVVHLLNTELRPDLVVHSGDVVGIDPDDDVDRSAALSLLATIKAPVLVVPGNHDVGAGGDQPWLGVAASSERVSRHVEAFGPVPFVETVAGWDVIGLNSEVMGSGLPEDDAQWRWLEATLGSTSGRPAVLFLHRPLWNHRPSRAADSNSVAAAQRERLLRMPGAVRIRAIGNGHLHWYGCHDRRGLVEIWAPSTGFAGPRYEDTEAFAQCGLVQWDLTADDVDARFCAPATLSSPDPRAVPEIEARIHRLQTRLGASPA